MKKWRGMGKFFIVSTIVLSSMLMLGASNEAAVIAMADKFYDEEQLDHSNKLLFELVETNPDSVDAYWMIARNFYELGNRVPIEKDKAKKLQMYIQCEEWAKKGYKRNPSLADNSFFIAVGLGMQGQTNGVARTILTNRTLAKQIETAFLNTLEAKEYHYKTDKINTIASAHLGLGIFYRKIPDLALMQILTGTKGDLTKAIHHLTIGREMFPNNLEITKELGVCYICRGQRKKNLGDIEEGKKFLKMVVGMPIERGAEQIEIDDAKRVLADLSLACGYSRVQQEEVTSDSLKKKQ